MRRPDDFDVVPTALNVLGVWVEVPRWMAGVYPELVVWDYRHNVRGKRASRAVGLA